MSATFPDPKTYDFPEWALYGDYFYKANDIISFGDELTAENVREAYRKGIFPWHIDGIPLPWFCPQKRAIIEFSELRIPRSLEKERRKNKFAFTIDNDFEAVIRACAESKREGQSGGTWINDEFIRVYSELHREGIVHSVEAWDEEGVGSHMRRRHPEGDRDHDAAQ